MMTNQYFDLHRLTTQRETIFKRTNKKFLKLIVPSWRPDISQAIDIVEELARIKGYDKIETIEPKRIRSKPTLNKSLIFLIENQISLITSFGRKNPQRKKNSTSFFSLKRNLLKSQ